MTSKGKVVDEHYMRSVQIQSVGGENPGHVLTMSAKSKEAKMEGARKWASTISRASVLGRAADAKEELQPAK